MVVEFEFDVYDTALKQLPPHGSVSIKQGLTDDPESIIYIQDHFARSTVIGSRFTSHAAARFTMK